MAIVIFLANIVLTVSPVYGASGATFNPGMNEGASRAIIELILEDTWAVTEAQSVLGLDAWHNGSGLRIIFCDGQAMEMGSFDPSTGTVVGAVPMCAGNTQAFGVTFIPGSPDTLWYTNDGLSPDLFYTEDFSNWSTEANPAGTLGHGMDFDGTDMWEAYSDSGVYRFQPGGAGEFISLPQVTGEISGLAVFPYNGNLGIVVTCLNGSDLYFYEWNGSDMSYLGFDDSPVTADQSFGLAYCEQNQMLYMSYSCTGSSMLAEMSFEILSSLEPVTWGQIKTVF